MLMKAREGDFLENFDGAIFDVKGLIHPPDRIAAFIRYFPNEKGIRIRDGIVYSKVYSFSDRYAVLRERWPEYIVHDPVFDETVCEVPAAEVKIHYGPVDKLRLLKNRSTLDPLENKALKFATLLKEDSNISWSTIGISGSILVNLHRADSDIDAIIYGSANCRNVHTALENMLDDPQSLFKRYTKRDLKGLFKFRSKDTAATFEDFVRTESRKCLQGKFAGADYFLRFVKEWVEIEEQYGELQYKNVGYAKIKATISDDSESIFTPCIYLLEHVAVVSGQRAHPITKIASFRGRFCEHAIRGETVIAQGKVEHVRDLKRNREYFRLLIGNKPSDFMALV
jgi:predicted nucleotidyltransferase